jgi:hypothetical protein
MRQDSVFLSFSSKDREAVREIHDRLEEAGIPTWFDETDIEAGDDWDRMIQANLVRASLFVAFVSVNTESLIEDARYFWLEWNLAHRRADYFAPGTKYIIPVALDTAQDVEGKLEPTKARVPDSFRAAQWFRLPGRTATAEFIDLIKTEYRRKQARPR